MKRNLLNSMSSLEKKVAGLIGLFLLSQSNNIKAQTFKPPVDNPFGLMYDDDYSVLLGDFVDIDNDGDQDFFSFGYQYGMNLDPGIAGYIYQENLGSASEPSFGIVQFNNFGVIEDAPNDQTNIGEFVDIDNDGDFDIIRGKFGYENYIDGLILYRNIGNAEQPNFIKSDSIDFGFNHEIVSYDVRDFELSDLDGDGDLDFLAASLSYDYVTEEYSRTILYLENISKGENFTFGPVQSNPFGLTIPENTIFTFLEAADLDEDGDQDIFLSRIGVTPEYEIEINYDLFWNNGSALVPDFAETPINNPFGFINENSSGVFPTFIDLDGDSDLDVFSRTYLGDTEESIYQFFENDETSAIVKFEDAFKFKLFPNPTSEILNINIPEKYIGENASIRIYDALGKLYHSETIDYIDSNYQTRISSWIPGMFNIYLEINGKAISKSFLKE